MSHELFSEKFDLTDQLKKILQPRASAFEKVQELDALVLGSSSTGILKKLEKLGFRRIEFTLNHIGDLQDLVELGQSLDLRQFCIFTSNSEFLNNFASRVNRMQKILESNPGGVGILGTVALRQGPKMFGPVLVPSAKSLPMSGMMIDLSNLSASPSINVDGIPSIRVKDFSDIRYLSKFVNTYEFLRHRFSNLPTIKLGEESVRQIVISGMANLSSAAVNDVAEDLRRLPRGRKRAVTYSLLASLPVLKPIVVVGKWLLRKKNS